MSIINYEVYIAACNKCLEACNACTAACLAQSDVDVVRTCIKLNLECAAICRTAVELMSLQSSFCGPLIELCMDICNDCAAECGLHASMGVEHCRVCAEACLHCATVCSTLPNIGEVA